MGEVVKLEELAKILQYFRLAKNKIGLCCGGYDLLHPGHMMHFESAKKICDVLIVAVTCDKFVSKRKGDGRPVFNENLRVYAVSMIRPVDFAFICPYETAIEAISNLKPDYYIKGSDYVNCKENNFLLERKAIVDVGGEMKFTLDEKLSTTEIIKYIKEKL